MLLLLACHERPPAPLRVESAPLVRLRPGDALPVLGPEARVDLGLRAAAEELAANATSASARLTPTATRLALSRAGYPGDARFLTATGGATPPEALLDALPSGPIDVGWAWRDLPDTRRLWIVAWAPRRLTLDPMPRDVALDGGVALRVDGGVEPRLLLGRPDGRVEELSLTPGRSRWLARFFEPGEYRVEIVDQDRVELLFSLFVDLPLPSPAPLPGPAPELPLAAAEAWLTGALATFRARAGLPGLTGFPAFAPHARAHAECLVAAGVLAHATPSCPGVPALAMRTHFPRARHHENVAAADTVEEAWERVLASPGHRLNLLCATCTHVALGVVRAAPRYFVVWEILEFTDGSPQPFRVER